MVDGKAVFCAGRTATTTVPRQEQREGGRGREPGYDAVELADLALLRAGDSDRSTLAVSVRQVAEAAEQWQAAEDARVAAVAPKNQPEYRHSYEITEVLTNLWRDIAAAHDGS